jgi:hypothetical protein
MTTDQINLTVLESSLRNVTQENEQLFRQLHQVQAELEMLHSKNRTFEAARPATSRGEGVLEKNWIDDDLIDALSEIEHLRALLEVQRNIHLLESKSTLSSRVGNILIKGVDSPASLFSAPGKLGRIWRESGRQEPPKSFGGKNFDKILATYSEGGFDAVEKLMSKTYAPPAIQANAYTALARQLIGRRKLNAAAEAARRAYTLDPKPYRLKWLAFRLHEDGQVIEAAAMLDSLSSSVQFSDSESRQVSQLRVEARRARQREAKQKTCFSERREEIARKISDLEREVNNKEKVIAANRQNVEALQRANLELESNQSESLREVNDLTIWLAQRDQKIEVLSQIIGELELEKAAFVARNAEVEAQIDSYEREIETLTQLSNDLEMEKTGLREQAAATAASIAERDLSTAALIAEQELAAVKLIAERESCEAKLFAERELSAAAAMLVAEQEKKFEALTQSKNELELEKARLMVRGESLETELIAMTKSRDEQNSLASQRQGELLQLARNEAAWEKEKLSLELRLGEREREIESITNAQGAQTRLVAKQIEEFSSKFFEQNDSVSDLLKKQLDEIGSARKHLDGVVKGEIANSTKQIQALVGLQSYYATGDLPAVNSERHSWPISQDFALFLVELIEINNYDLVIEFGSGISSVIIAKGIKKTMQRRHDSPDIKFVSFEHLEQYYKQTLARLQQVKLENSVELVLAPLQAWTAPSGNVYSYYSCEDHFEDLAKKYAKTGSRILAVVDGPPAATGKHARYPAAPLLLKHFAQAHIDILLDDYIRDDEKEVTKMWQAEMQSAYRSCGVTTRRFDKDACLISTSPAISTGNA